MKIPEAMAVRREKWRNIGLGELIMISLFMLTDGIAKIRNGGDFAWLVASAGAISLVMWTVKALSKR